eukprot:jgi/Ulvmu1/3890/UM018_0111.1
MEHDEFHAVEQSTVAPAFLHANSTSHATAFGAIAELIDNAIDPDVTANRVVIDVMKYGDESCLVCFDDGVGLDPHRLKLMLGFGHSNKLEEFQGKAIGQYGNGFKSGSMRLGRDALILTQDRTTRLASIGFLSQTFNEEVRPNSLKTPIVTWFVRSDGSIQRVCAVRCEAKENNPPPSHGARETARNMPRCEEGEAQHSARTTTAERDPLATCQPAAAHPGVEGNDTKGAGCRGSAGAGSQRKIAAVTAADAADLRALRRMGWRLEEPDECSDQSLRAICRFSAVRRCCDGEGDGMLLAAQEWLEAQVCEHVQVRVGQHTGTRRNAGTHIIISGLRTVRVRDNAAAPEVTELDFDSDPHDMRLRDATLTRSAAGRCGADRSADADVPCDYSLLEYLKILYHAPHFDLFLRDSKVRTKRMVGCLGKPRHTTYHPRSSQDVGTCKLSAEITVGYNVEDIKQYGVLVYHKGRLVEAFKRVKPLTNFVGILVIVTENFLDVGHNKQSFTRNPDYTKLDNKIRQSVSKYAAEWENEDVPGLQAAMLAMRGTAHSAAAARGAAGTRHGGKAADAAARREAALAKIPLPEVLPDCEWLQCTGCRHWRVLERAKGEAVDNPDTFTCAAHPNAAKRCLGCTDADDEDPKPPPRLRDVKRAPTQKPGKRAQHSRAQHSAQQRDTSPPPVKRRRRDGAHAAVLCTPGAPTPGTAAEGTGTPGSSLTRTAQHAPCSPSTGAAASAGLMRLMLHTIAELAGDQERMVRIHETGDAELAGMGENGVVAEVVALRAVGGLPELPPFMADAGRGGAMEDDVVVVGEWAGAPMAAACSDGSGGAAATPAGTTCRYSRDARRCGSATAPRRPARHAARSARVQCVEAVSVDSSRPSTSSSEGEGGPCGAGAASRDEASGDASSSSSSSSDDSDGNSEDESEHASGVETG